MKKNVTLKDIAKIVNLSETSVSLVLSGAKNRISQEKRDEIHRVAKALNYRPNLLARGLSLQKSFTIGLIIPDIINPFFSRLADAIENYLSKKDYLLFVSNSNDNLSMDKKLLKRFIDYQVDGIIYCPANESYSLDLEEKQELLNFSTPLVMVDRIFVEIKNNRVYFDNELGGYLATKHLIDSGCKKIACITGDTSTFSGKHRFMGYQRALKEMNLEINSEIIFAGDYRFESAYKINLDILKKHKVDGIFASNDLMAYGLMKKLNDNNFKDDIKIVGYDDLRQSEMFGIKIKSISQDIDKLARKSCEQIIEKIANPKFSKSTKLSPVLK